MALELGFKYCCVENDFSFTIDGILRWDENFAVNGPIFYEIKWLDRSFEHTNTHTIYNIFLKDDVINSYFSLKYLFVKNKK